MGTQDILFNKKKGIFSYRVAGILVREGKVLLQHGVDTAEYAFPGGHVRLGEISIDALVREIKEETGADVTPGRLLWVGENFFPWGKKYCHQIHLYFLITLADEHQIPLEGHFMGRREEGEGPAQVEFCWVDLEALEGLTVYPTCAAERLPGLPDQHPPYRVEHFVYIQKSAEE